jgi:hypothetical protein
MQTLSPPTAVYRRNVKFLEVADNKTEEVTDIS